MIRQSHRIRRHAFAENVPRHHRDAKRHRRKRRRFVRPPNWYVQSYCREKERGRCPSRLILWLLLSRCAFLQRGSLSLSITSAGRILWLGRRRFGTAVAIFFVRILHHTYLHLLRMIIPGRNFQRHETSVSMKSYQHSASNARKNNLLLTTARRMCIKIQKFNIHPKIDR